MIGFNTPKLLSLLGILKLNVDSVLQYVLKIYFRPSDVICSCLLFSGLQRNEKCFYFPQPTIHKTNTVLLIVNVCPINQRDTKVVILLGNIFGSLHSLLGIP